ncbi:hypothetical protein VNO78_09485 [Psophocarpus tetragonolobus]|uniref:Uncharacterized protein n=1 Tax=Psophocarpus tetragonolobus TaxID=3891 RepID=A0AAN9T856_PSOTE
MATTEASSLLSFSLKVCSRQFTVFVGIKEKEKVQFKFYVAYSTTMFFAGGKRFLHLSLMVLLGVTMLQMWMCWDSCQVGAIRAFPSNAIVKVKFSRGVEDDKEDLLHKHFIGSTFGLNNGTQKGFDETKRRVPSCPDPLHN